MFKPSKITKLNIHNHGFRTLPYTLKHKLIYAFPGKPYISLHNDVQNTTRQSVLSTLSNTQPIVKQVDISGDEAPP